MWEEATRGNHFWTIFQVGQRLWLLLTESCPLNKAHWEACQRNPYPTWEGVFLSLMRQSSHKMPPKSWSKLRLKRRGLCKNKECCPPSILQGLSHQPLWSLTYAVHLKRNSGKDQDEAFCATEKQKLTLRWLTYFQEKILWIQLLDSSHTYRH